MSIEQAQAFFEKVKNDQELQKRLSEAKDNESKLEIARQEGFEFDLEEAKKARETNEELSDEEMESVAGGRLYLLWSDIE
jgi:predicted ribosomally synthesized peptide with nif11-like leader